MSDGKNPVGEMISSLLQPYTELSDRREPVSDDPVLTSDERAQIANARAIENEIEHLLSVQETILMPIVTRLMDVIIVAQPAQRQQLIEAIRKIPSRFYRSELMTAVNMYVGYDDDGDDRK